ncbi:putative P-loop containing nucleoside triphosphate hydrolase [Helianthus anomalus]
MLEAKHSFVEFPTSTCGPFPVKVCFAITINKSQGQTFNDVCVCLIKSIFTHG